IDIASAEGELMSISCPTGPQNAKVGIGVKTGVAGIYLGNLTSPFDDLNKAPVVSRASIAKLSTLLGIEVALYARAQIPLGDNVQRTLYFSSADIQNKKIQTVRSSKLLGSLTSALIRDMNVEVNLLGLPIDISGVFLLLGTLLTPVSGLLDNLLFGVLDLLGVKLGEADVQVTGVLCQRAVLTQ